MASQRTIVFREGYFYHIYNRGVERRPIFLSPREYQRFMSLLDYYRFKDVSLSYSRFLKLPLAERADFIQKLEQKSAVVDILCFCLMPNHFHLLLRQNQEKGILRFLSNIENGYAKYFNIKHQRVGPLYQGPFKAVFIETDEQLVHLSRYIHINPVVSSLVEINKLNMYPWSSFLSYLGKTQNSFVKTEQVLSNFRRPSFYKDFVFDQIEYAKELERIKHLLQEEV